MITQQVDLSDFKNKHPIKDIFKSDWLASKNSPNMSAMLAARDKKKNREKNISVGAKCGNAAEETKYFKHFIKSRLAFEQLNMELMVIKASPRRLGRTGRWNIVKSAIAAVGKLFVEADEVLA